MDVPTIVQMLKMQASRNPGKTAIFDHGFELTYGELKDQADALAGYLVEAGLKKGARVGLLLDKTAEAIVAFLGVARAGGVVFPLNYNQTSANLQETLQLTDPFALVIASRYLPLVDDGADVEKERLIIVLGEPDGRGGISWQDVLKSAGAGSFPEISPDDLVYLNFTSGSTGHPKGAETTHAQIYWNTLASIECLELTPEDIHLCMFPVFVHPHELFARPLLLGGSFVLVDGVAPRTIAAAIEKHGVTCMMATASIYVNLARHSRANHVSLESLRIAESGGMHISAAMYTELTEALGIPLYPVWGSTETTGIAIANRPGHPYKPGSAGTPCPYYDITLIDSHGGDVVPGHVGEMVVSGPGVCARYFRNPVETGKHMKNGSTHTGDLFIRDANNHYSFVGRLSRMIKAAGLRIYPDEVQAVLNTHPEIAEAAVVRGKHPSRGEVPKAVIVMNAGAPPDAEAIRHFCEERMARYKVPRLYEFVDQLPKTDSGKILYSKLDSPAGV
jgi:long-chain acyl-CoA synthetase